MCVMRPIKPWEVGVVATGAVVADVWGSLAVGSYVYYSGMGYLSDFGFPWTQIWHVVPAVIHEPWHGLPSLTTWLWLTAAVLAACFPSIILLRFGSVLFFKRRRQPLLYGETGWADAHEMRRNGVTISKDIS
jgi:hypothetical protein